MACNWMPTHARMRFREHRSQPSIPRTRGHSPTPYMYRICRAARARDGEGRRDSGTNFLDASARCPRPG
eukprot:13098737-Heterocapsa_arctica.AAC.1